jgi:flagellar biosynthesis anti-sigma factor FlgM
MRIDLNNRIPEAQDSGQMAAKTGAASSASASSSPGLGVDTATFSSDAARVQALADKVSGLPDIRQERVAALAEALRSGSYSTAPEQTAEALLSQLAIHPAA